MNFSRLILILCLILVYRTDNFGQFTSVSGNTFSNLIVPLSITALSGDLNFGQILLTGVPQNPEIKPKNGKLFEITGQPKRKVTVTYNPVILSNSQWAATNSGQLGTMRFNPKVIKDNGKNVKSGKSIRLKREGLIGKEKLWVGGTLNVAANQPEGDYIGLFVISVSY
ncbi:hypothetical protein BMS3Abin04_01082 [bacterium BMS3Abin04]|nr:hypothetical protein BMS3Abin04_01082 [bacterium BMS3Abin04]